LCDAGGWGRLKGVFSHAPIPSGAGERGVGNSALSTFLGRLTVTVLLTYSICQSHESQRKRPAGRFKTTLDMHNCAKIGQVVHSRAQSPADLSAATVGWPDPMEPMQGICTPLS
jgi:hypothetical protein